MKFAHKILYKQGVETSALFNSKKECHKAALEKIANKPEITSYGIVGMRYRTKKDRATGRTRTIEDWCYYEDFCVKKEKKYVRA